MGNGEGFSAHLQVLFPNAQKLEEAWQQKDRHGKTAGTAPGRACRMRIVKFAIKVKPLDHRAIEHLRLISVMIFLGRIQSHWIQCGYHSQSWLVYIGLYWFMAWFMAWFYPQKNPDAAGQQTGFFRTCRGSRRPNHLIGLRGAGEMTIVM